MVFPISPWSTSVDCVSPNGRFRAVILDAWEIGMGAPTSGALLIYNASSSSRAIAEFERCNPSLVWSSASDALAIPRWTDSRQQRLCVISVPSGSIIAEADGFRVLELHEFIDGVVRFVDSPGYMPRALEFVLENSDRR